MTVFLYNIKLLSINIDSVKIIGITECHHITHNKPGEYI